MSKSIFILRSVKNKHVNTITVNSVQYKEIQKNKQLDLLSINIYPKRHKLIPRYTTAKSPKTRAIFKIQPRQLFPNNADIQISTRRHYSTLQKRSNLKVLARLSSGSALRSRPGARRPSGAKRSRLGQPVYI